MKKRSPSLTSPPPDPSLLPGKGVGAWRDHLGRATTDFHQGVHWSPPQLARILLLMGALGHSLDAVSGRVQPMSSTFKQGNTQVLPPAPQETTPLVPGGFRKPTTPAEQAAIQAAMTRVWAEHQGRGHGASSARADSQACPWQVHWVPPSGPHHPKASAPGASSSSLWSPSSLGSSCPRLVLASPYRNQVGHPRGSRGETPVRGSPRETKWSVAHPVHLPSSGLGPH